MSKLTEILSHAPVKFPIHSPVKVGVFNPVRIYGIEKTDSGEVMVQINDGSFHKLEETDKNYDLVADTLLNRLNESIPKTKDFKCPNCNTWHNDSDLGYEVDGIHYPIYRNEVKGSTMDGSYHDWDEIHKCENCKSKFWFRNGAF